MQAPEQFRMLDNAEFAALSTPQKVEYLKAAVEAQRLLNEQIELGLKELYPQAKR